LEVVSYCGYTSACVAVAQECKHASVGRGREGWREGFSFPLKTSVPPEGLAFIVPFQGIGSFSTL